MLSTFNVSATPLLLPAAYLLHHCYYLLRTSQTPITPATHLLHPCYNLLQTSYTPTTHLLRAKWSVSANFLQGFCNRPVGHVFSFSLFTKALCWSHVWIYVYVYEEGCFRIICQTCCEVTLCMIYVGQVKHCRVFTRRFPV